MRRTTLGPISNVSNINDSDRLNNIHKSNTGPTRIATASRSSYIPPSRRSSTSLAPPRAPREVLSTHSTRRSSAFGSRTTKSDPRPISDKKYQTFCIRQVIHYLSSRKYDDILSPKMLQRPMKKDFINIMNFLIRILDPSFKLLEKFEDQVIMIYRYIRYPFAVSKTGLVACGSPHAWPPLLASLAWFVELLLYDEAVVASPCTVLENDGGPKLFFQYLELSYKSFLSGDDDQYLALEGSFSDKIIKNQNEIEATIEVMEKENLELEMEIQRAEMEKSTLPQLNSKKKDFESDLEKFKTLITALEAHQKNLTAKLRARQQESVGKDSDLVKCSTKIQRLQHQIDTQELSIHDVEYMSTEHARLTSQVSAANTRKESVLENKRNITHAITQVLSELEMALVDYSTIAHRLKLLPLGAKHALDQNFEVRLDTAASNASNTAILTADLKTHIRPALSALKKNRTIRMNAALDVSQEIQVHCDRICDAGKVEIELKERVELQVLKMDDLIGVEKLKLENISSIKGNELENIELNIQKEKAKEVQAGLQQSLETLAHVQKSRMEQKETQSYQLQEALQYMTTALMQVAEHKEKCVSQLV